MISKITKMGRTCMIPEDGVSVSANAQFTTFPRDQR